MKQLKIYLQVTICVITLILWTTSTALAQKKELKMVNPDWGYASIKNKDSKYFRFSAKITAPAGRTHILTLENCVLYGSDGKIYKKPYIAVAGASKGSSTSVGSGVYVNSLNIIKNSKEVNLENDLSVMETVKIDEPHGKFEFKFGEDGFFDFVFLWAVPKDFKPGRVIILDSFDLDLK